MQPDETLHYLPLVLVSKSGREGSVSRLSVPDF